MKMKKTEKIGDVLVRGIHLVITQRWNDEMTVTDYVLSAKWREIGKDGWVVNKQKKLGTCYTLTDAIDMLAVYAGRIV